MENELMSLPMVALRGLAVLPEQVTHFDVSREKSVQAITQAMKKDQKIFLVMQKEVEVEEPKESDLYRIGCIATVKQIVKLPGNMKRVLVSGEQRAGLSWIESEEPYFQVAVKILPDFCKPEDRELLENPINEEGMVRGLRELFRDYMSKNPKLAKELAMMIEEIKSARHGRYNSLPIFQWIMKIPKKFWKSRIFFRDMKTFLFVWSMRCAYSV